MRPLLVAAPLVLAAACGPAQSPAPPPAAPAEAPAAAAAAATASAPARRGTRLLWPAADADGLVARDAEIFATLDPADQARQVVGLLLAGAPDPGVAPPLPQGTTLTALFVDDRGIAYVSLSRQAVESAPGGSSWERLAVHSLAGSLTRAVPQVRRVQILIDGKEIETLAGHLDLRRPVAFDASLLAP